jgi:hypothetical protein
VDRHDRHVILMITSVLVLALVPGCTDASTPIGSPLASPEPDVAHADVDQVIAEVASAPTGRVSQVHTIGIPDDVGGSATLGLDASFDRPNAAFDGEFDFHSDPGEYSPLTTWPADVPVGLRVRVVGDQVWAAQGVAADEAPFRDITAAADRAEPIAQLTTIFALVELLADAVDLVDPEPLDGVAATWRGTVPPEVLGDVWQEPGAVGSVTRVAGAIPLEYLEGGFIYEVERSDDGRIRLSLWLDAARIAENLGESMDEDVAHRVDMTWSGLGDPVSIRVPESARVEESVAE